MNNKNLALNIKNLIDENLDRVIELRSEKKIKKDNSFVTKGDVLLSEILKQFFKSLFEDFDYVSEEDYQNRDKWDRSKSYIFVDPIDGTENFVSGLKEWGVGISIYQNENHNFSFIYLPELRDYHYSGAKIQKFRSRINGLSSSLTINDLKKFPDNTNEVRIMGCSMYNMFNVIRGSFKKFENIKGVNCWDILPGINLALEAGCKVYVNENQYNGEILFPDKRYKIRITN
jgi:myo-inositol-1(or 4)-monophosphatase